MNKHSLLSLLVALPPLMEAASITIIPQPQEVQESQKSFQLGSSLTIHSEAVDLAPLVDLCQETLNARFPVTHKGDTTKIRLLEATAHQKFGKEDYLLEISQSKGITITASSPAGHFYGFQSFLQLLPDELKQDATLPEVKIKDSPRFQWRGMHLDESRHFYGKDFVKKYIDLLAAYKMNVFHWHLIDDGGWRLEIKKYPKLTKLGGFRKGTAAGWRVTELEFPKSEQDLKSGDWYGGFYTQEDIKEIVAYAKIRNVRIIPEIEMPGHSLPAISAYPELACGGDLKDDGEGWTPSSQNSYCAGKEATYTFLEDVLTEVMALFPDEYIHIGGDEVIKKFWDQCPHCQAQMRKERIKNTNELQSYFIRRMEKYINAHNRHLIGWDEITHGGLAPNATVMFWIGMGAVPETVKKGHNVIMTPMSPCYFDYAYSSNSTERVYNWNPVPEEFMGSAYEKQFLGAQGNVWTEWMETSDRVEYMVMPRMIAMAETLWTSNDKKDLRSFKSRLTHHFSYLDHWDVNYRIPNPEPNATTHLFSESTSVTFQTPPKGFQIHYTTDGSEPTMDSPVYTTPIKVDKPLTVKSMMAKSDRHSEITAIHCSKFSPIKVSDLKPGLTAQYAEGKWKKVPDFATLSDVRSSVVQTPNLDIRKRNDNFACRFTGYIKVPQSGPYTFSLASDDGSLLRIGGNTIIDHDGPHGYSAKTGTVLLQTGIYPIDIGYLEVGGAERLDIKVTTPGGSTGDLPASILFHKEGALSTNTKLTTELPASGKHKASHIIDGNRGTYFWVARKVSKNETINLKLNTPIARGKTVVVHTGLPDGGDQFDNGVLEGSLDGKTWAVLAQETGGILAAKLTRPLKHFRLRATQDIPHWIAVREFEITDQSPLSVKTGKVRYKGTNHTIRLIGHMEGFEDLQPHFDEIASLYFDAWPKIIHLIDAPVHKTRTTVNIVFNDKIKHPAHAFGDTITMSSGHLRRNKSDAKGVFVHELTHIIQNHSGPGWFIEGVADYVRFKVINNDGWAKHNSQHINYNKPLGAYWASAAFLLYLEDKYQKPIVKTVSSSLRDKTYHEGIWKELTGHTLEELTTEYQKSNWKPTL
ncbi:family 20 glycosylhydrolase [Rubritalea halochordaticola]